MKRWVIALPVAFSLGAATQPVPPDAWALPEVKARLCTLYGLPEPACGASLDIRVVPTPADAPAGWSDLPSYAAGAAHAPSGRILVIASRTGAYPFGDEAQTVRHELSHVLLYRGLGFSPPRWFDEGLAMRASGEWGWADEWYAALALPRVASGEWSLQRVEGDFAGGEGQVRGSYALARGFVRDLFADDRSVREFVLLARQAGSVENAFQMRFGLTPDDAFREWAKHLPWWAEELVLFTSPGFLWFVVTALFFLAVLAALRRRFHWRRRWEEEEGDSTPSGPTV